MRTFALFVPWLALMGALVACDRPASPSPSALSARIASPAPPQAAGPSELALVAPLVPGAHLDGYEVREVRAIVDGLLTVICQKDRATVRLSVALAADEGPDPPATAGPYAVFYSLRNAQPEDGERLAKALADILRTHADLPPPPGMTPFSPQPIPI